MKVILCTFEAAGRPFSSIWVGRPVREREEEESPQEFGGPHILTYVQLGIPREWRFREDRASEREGTEGPQIQP